MHTCDISLFRRELPIFCLSCTKSPYEKFQNLLYILYISLFGISDLPTKLQEFPSLFNHSPYLENKISLFVFWDVSHVWVNDSILYFVFSLSHQYKPHLLNLTKYIILRNRLYFHNIFRTKILYSLMLN